MRRTRLAALAAFVLAGWLLAPGQVAPASAGTVAGACTTSKGVTVVVNFASLGGGTVIRCYSGAGSSTTGVGALQGAGFSPEGTSRYGLAFVCRISGKPASDPCVNTPPATAYWSYWYASNGGSWAYSSKGAQNRSVILGGFEGWSFHSGSGSNTPPTSGSPTRPKPQPTPTVGLGPAASTSTTHQPATPASGRSTTGKPTATKGSPTTAATGTSTSATPLAGGSTSSTDAAGGALPGDPPAPGRSPWPFVGGATAIGLILAGAGVTVSRRRGSSGV